jgi:hypothetical protein
VQAAAKARFPAPSGYGRDCRAGDAGDLGQRVGDELELHHRADLGLALVSELGDELLDDLRISRFTANALPEPVPAEREGDEGLEDPGEFDLQGEDD